MIATIKQGLEADGIQVPMTKLCRWFEVPRRTVYYRPTKATSRVQERFEAPIRAMIEEEPSFGYRTVAGLLGFNKNTVQRVFQLRGWQVKKRPVGFRPRIQAMPSVATAPDERWATDLCWDAGEEGAERCPPEVVAAPVIDKARLDARARDNLQQLARSLVLTANARNPVEKPAASESVKPKPVVNRADDVVTGRLLAWARSLSAKDVEGYFSFYSPDFRPELSSVEAWRSQRQQRIETASSIQVTISEVLAAPAGTDAMETRFRQRYESGTFADESERRILWRRIKDQWFIISESGR
jgi:hypothetical protein